MGKLVLILFCFFPFPAFPTPRHILPTLSLPQQRPLENTKLWISPHEARSMLTGTGSARGAPLAVDLISVFFSSAPKEAVAPPACAGITMGRFVPRCSC